MIKPLIDVNVSIGFWPFQNFVTKTPALLVNHMHSLDIDFSLVSAIESVLFADPDFYDAACFDQMKKHPNLLPVKTVNPTLGNWRESLHLFVQKYKITAVKIFPNYHNYSLLSLEVKELIQEATNLKLPIMIPLRLEDERQQHWCLNVPAVSMQDLISLAEEYPKTYFIALNAYSWEATSIPEEMSNLYSDIAFCEALDTLQAMTCNFKTENLRLLFGSATPFLTTDSALGKLKGGTADNSVRQQIIKNSHCLFEKSIK